MDGEEITEVSCRKIALATASIIERNALKKELFLGYDLRENSKKYAIEMAKVLQKHGVCCHLLPYAVPSGFVSYICKEKLLDLSIIVTASHNPYSYNGVKIFSKNGQDLTEDLEKQYNEEMSNDDNVTDCDGEVVYYAGQDDLEDEYVADICSSLTKMHGNISVAYDTMHGSSDRLARKLADRLDINCHVIDSMSINCHVIDSMSIAGKMFSAPIPSKENTYLHKDYVIENNLDFSFATDGDGDRMAVITRDGVYHDAGEVAPFLYYFAVNEKKLKGGFVGNYSYPVLGRLTCEKLDVPYHESKIGFKHIGKLMVDNNALMGSENSSLSYAPISYFKDGLVAFALLCEAVSFYGKALEVLLQEFKEKMGYNFNYLERSFHFEMISSGDFRSVLSGLEMTNFRPIIMGEKCHKIDSLDGYKYYFPSTTLLIRQSGTEAVIRFVVESNFDAKEVLKSAKNEFTHYAKSLLKLTD